MNKNNEEQQDRLRSLEIFAHRRPVMNSTEELGGIGAKEELPERGEGETEINSRIADRSDVPRLSKKEQTFPMSCERPLYMEERGSMERERRR